MKPREFQYFAHYSLYLSCSEALYHKYLQKINELTITIRIPNFRGFIFYGFDSKVFIQTFQSGQDRIIFTGNLEGLAFNGIDIIIVPIGYFDTPNYDIHVRVQNQKDPEFPIEPYKVQVCLSSEFRNLIGKKEKIKIEKPIPYDNISSIFPLKSQEISKDILVEIERTPSQWKKDFFYFKISGEQAYTTKDLPINFIPLLSFLKDKNNLIDVPSREVITKERIIVQKTEIINNVIRDFEELIKKILQAIEDSRDEIEILQEINMFSQGKKGFRPKNLTRILEKITKGDSDWSIERRERWADSLLKILKDWEDIRPSRFQQILDSLADIAGKFISDRVSDGIASGVEALCDWIKSKRRD